MPTPDTTVYHRAVFYIPGFDPLPPRRYRELYRREGTKQAEISGYSLAQRRAPSGNVSQWQTEFENHDGRARTVFTCLVWTDIVKAAMVPSLWNIYVRSFWFYSIFLTSGAIARMRRIAVGPAIVALYPPVVTALQLVLGLALGLAVFFVTQGTVGSVLAAFGGTLAVWLWLKLMRWADKWLYAHYLMLDYAFYGEGKGALPKALSERVDAFVAQISDALQGPFDEVLVVGHSSGAQLGVTVVARLLEGGATATRKLNLLTLGHSIPMISFLPKGQELRRDLQRVSEAGGLTWLDVSAPGDGACFPLTDPVGISGVARAGQCHPKVISAAFSKTLSPKQQNDLRFRFFKKHFQYLCAFEYPDQYDYFQLTSGPRPFARQVEKLRESPSKITRNFSGHTDV